MLHTILDRYIFRELFSPFGISLAALCFVMLTKELLRLVELLVTKGIGFLSVLKVFAHLLPSFLVLTPAHCGHHCHHYGLRPLVPRQGTRGDARRRLQPPAAVSVGVYFRRAGLRPDAGDGAVRATLEQRQSQEGGAEPVARRTRVGTRSRRL
ncbi:MAG: LptF/LptG family permease [Nitrospira sp.]|nr:LptF/LptG family permease [Nitrospira sp.]